MAKDKKLGWKIGSTVIIVCFAIIIIFILWFLNPGDSKEIVSAANQFKAGVGWHLKTEHIEPPSRICIDVDCPSVQRSWAIPSPLTKPEVQNFIKDAGWKISDEDECFRNKYTNQKWPDCYIEATKGKFKAVLYVLKTDQLSDSKPTVSLTISER